MSEIRNTQRVRKGDCAWNFAKQQLKRQNKSVKNADIIKEMNRLAKINGCDDYEDFNEKFFSNVGKEVKVVPEQNQKQKTVQKTKHKPVQKANKKPSQRQVPKDSARAVAPKVSTKVVAPKDSTRVVAPKDSTKVVAPKDSTKVVAPKDSSAVNKKTKLTLGDPKENKYNSIKGDSQRIIAYNRDNYTGKYYGIVDKKSAQLKIYDRQGNVVKTFKVSTGKNSGDNVSFGYASKNKSKKEAGRYTTPGEFTLDEYATYSNRNYISQKDNKHKVMALKGDNRGDESGQTAIHMVPNNRKDRIGSNGQLNSGRQSYGCVNMTEKDYDIMHQYLGEGDKIFILPEEQGNRLNLKKQKDGSYKFEQAHHKEDKRAYSKEVASTVKYDVRKDKNPRLIAARKAAQERQLAQQKAEQETKWYNPMTWFS